MAHIPEIILLIFLAWPSKKVQGEKSITSCTVKKRTVPWILLRWICTTSKSDSCCSSGSLATALTLPGKGTLPLHQMILLPAFLLCSLFSLLNSHSNGLSEEWSCSCKLLFCLAQGNNLSQSLPEWWGWRGFPSGTKITRRLRASLNELSWTQ